MVKVGPWKAASDPTTCTKTGAEDFVSVGCARRTEGDGSGVVVPFVRSFAPHDALLSFKRSKRENKRESEAKYKEHGCWWGGDSDRACHRAQFESNLRHDRVSLPLAAPPLRAACFDYTASRWTPPLFRPTFSPLRACCSPARHRSPPLVEEKSLLARRRRRRRRIWRKVAESVEGLFVSGSLCSSRVRIAIRFVGDTRSKCERGRRKKIERDPDESGARRV